MQDRRTFIITGGNSGLGLECAARIAARAPACPVILACRSMEKAAEAQTGLIARTGNTAVLALELDVSSLASVRAFAARYKALELPPLGGLVCNAGIVGARTGQTEDGFDLVFATNHLGHFLLTCLLLPAMQPTGRIVSVSSDMHSPPGPELGWPGVEALAHPTELAVSSARYSYSKLCNLYFIYALSKKLVRMGSGITANAFNPGLMTETNFAPDKSRFTEEFLRRVSDRIGSLEKSSAALAELMTEPAYGQRSGKYYDRGTAYADSSPLSYHEGNAAELWDKSVGYTGLTPGDTLPGLLP